MVRIKWTEQAKTDLQDIYLFISKGSLKYAKLTIFALRNRTNILKLHIKAGTKVREYESENIRELIEGNYRIICFIKTEISIDILTVLHSAKNRNL
jgi:toxin ParE1/3/4